MKRFISLFMCAAFLAMVVPSILTAATEAEKRAAIDAGLEYLAQQQLADGRWNYGDDNYDTAATGAALLSFHSEGYSAGADVVINGTNYGDVVGKGLDYVFSKATSYAISPEPTGNPDSNGNGIGVKFVPGGNNTRDTYVTGIVVPGIASAGTPNKVITTGSQAGRTYGAVIQDTVDYFAYGQSDPGTWGQGGWRYYADYGQSDNSTAQWPVIGMLFAEGAGVSAPGFVESELDVWINYVQNADGGSDYDGGWGSNMSRTGTLTAQMGFSNWDNEPGVANAMFGDNQAAFDAAVAYIDSQWQTSASSTWNGNFDHPYAMWAVYKGLETTIGLDDTTAITNLRDQAALRGGAGAPLDSGDFWNWWEDYNEWLVQDQNADGSWSGYSYWTGPLATAWHINILNATNIPDPDPEPYVPEPASIVVWSLLGCCIFGVARRKRRQAR